MPEGGRSEERGERRSADRARGNPRRSRRASRPATGGVAQVGGTPDQTRDDVDPREPGGATPADRWWQEQRPPHWE
ncbi:hypothetical protein PZ938_01325 [Luteipulveratus sp. YIM 133132]|uniref:hypothetical protein n=1 Tax=Luteipulveratus flavus TaxID=3031728 RepID=UPI0023AFC157|nr:hypothetical protein [Luteipulveratus sp. YIM 133132]MDE9364235.1 hypothetical protein [Luteipulveratus sp. YIM 133132]